MFGAGGLGSAGREPRGARVVTGGDVLAFPPLLSELPAPAKWLTIFHLRLRVLSKAARVMRGKEPRVDVPRSGTSGRPGGSRLRDLTVPSAPLRPPAPEAPLGSSAPSRHQGARAEMLTFCAGISQNTIPPIGRAHRVGQFILARCCGLEVRGGSDLYPMKPRPGIGDTDLWGDFPVRGLSSGVKSLGTAF